MKVLFATRYMRKLFVFIYIGKSEKFIRNSNLLLWRIELIARNTPD